MNTLVATRPQRTSREIAADRKEANAFYARLESYNPTNPNGFHRDLRRQLKRELRFNYKLMMAWSESRGWSQTLLRRNPSPQQRVKDPGYRARHFHRFREDCNLRPYVSTATRNAMPTPQLHMQPEADKKRSITATKNYWQARRGSISPRLLARLKRDRAPFEHWLLHPHNWRYGPAAEENEEPATPSWLKFRRGQVRPSGMTPERALQIALASLPS